MEPEVLLTLVSSDEDERCRRRRRRFQRARAGIWLPLLARAENTPRQGRLRTLQASEEAAEAAETAVTDINLHTHLLHMLKLAVESAFLETALNSYRIFVLMCATDICRAERGQPKCIRESRAQQPPPHNAPQQGSLFIGAERRFTLSSMAAVCCPLLDTRAFMTAYVPCEEWWRGHVTFNHISPPLFPDRKRKTKIPIVFGKRCIQYFTV